MILTVDNTDLSTTYGMLCVRSQGELDMLKVKKGNTQNYNDEHGEDIDLSQVFYEPREIQLDFIIKATSNTDFVAKMRDFAAFITAPGLHVLKYPIINRPFFVYCMGDANLDKLTKWNSALMAGKFNIKLIEPRPVGRVFSTPQNSILVVSITTTSLFKPIEIYWGDGTMTVAAAGTSVVTTHNYTATRALYYVLVAGDVQGSVIVSKSGNLAEITT